MKRAFLAGFIGFLLLGLSLGSNPFGFACLLLALSSLVGAVIWWAADFRKPDPYDLNRLHQIHEQEARRAIEDQLEAVDSAGNAICLNCGNHFDPMLHRCPGCGKSLFQ